MYRRQLAAIVLFMFFTSQSALAGGGSGPDPIDDKHQFDGKITPTNAQDGKNVRGTPGIVRLDLTFGSPGSQRDASDDGDALPGAAVGWVGVDIIPPDKDIDIVKDVITHDRNGKQIVTSTYVRTERHITYMCNGQVFKTIIRCIRGDCPPPSTTPPRKISINKLIKRLVDNGTLTLPMPEIVSTPKPSDIAPLVGMPFFYGVSATQFNEIITEPLTICFDEDCGSLIASAAPRAVYLDPKNSLPNDPDIKTTCRQPIPQINSAADAAPGLPARNCAVVFQNAGHYTVEFGLAYELIWTINRWNFTQRPPIERGSKQLVVWTNTEITTHQIQPVLTNR